MSEEVTDLLGDHSCYLVTVRHLGHVFFVDHKSDTFSFFIDVVLRPSAKGGTGGFLKSKVCFYENNRFSFRRNSFACHECDAWGQSQIQRAAKRKLRDMTLTHSRLSLMKGK